MKQKKIPENIKELVYGTTISQDGCKILELERNEQYSLAYGELAVGEESKAHKMEMQELYYIIQGKGKITVNKEEKEIEKGDIIILPEEAVQKLENTGKEPLKFLMIVNPPYDSEKEQIVEEL
ncbi:MAG: cupin domain-containing protein [Candidatus Heimdallarchaeota archaeon]|nr:cupin domain-containing protein [Candidatus Heimdallarchaeota archaeon]MBY8993830.1 cupin domain-containing protein [Candidatus Heimdallarchaeota archaeon]